MLELKHSDKINSLRTEVIKTTVGIIHFPLEWNVSHYMKCVADSFKLHSPVIILFIPGQVKLFLVSGNLQDVRGSHCVC